MNEYDKTVVGLLTEIRNLLIPIAAHYEPEYTGTKQRELEGLLSTEAKKRIYSLLFDQRRLSQLDIAKEAQTTQPSVSRLVASLLEAGLIGRKKQEDGKDVYHELFRPANGHEAK